MSVSVTLLTYYVAMSLISQRAHPDPYPPPEGIKVVPGPCIF